MAVGLASPTLENPAGIESLSITGAACYKCLAPMNRATTLTLLAAFAVGCAPREPVAPAPGNPGVELHGVTLHYFQGERVATLGTMAQLTYQRFTHDFVGTDSDLEFPRPAPGQKERVALYGFRIRSPILRGNIRTRRSTAIGGVKFLADNGTVGTTARAVFDGIARRAEGSDPVEVVGSTYTINAGNFSFHLDDEDYAFGNDVTTVLTGRAP